MNNQAAQTMPELPEPFQKAVIANRINTMAVRQGYEVGGYEKSPDLYTADQMRAMYQQGYAAALSQTAVVAEGWRAEIESILSDAARGGPPVGRDLCCLSCGNWTPINHPEAHDHEDDCAAKAEWDARLKWQSRLYTLLAAAPSASGGEVWTREMVADVHRRGEELYRRIHGANPPPAASVSERARELLAAEFEKDGLHDMATAIRAGHPNWELSLRAIEQALTQQRGEREDAHKFRRLAQLLDGFDFRLGRNALMPPATYLDSVEITCEFQPGIGQSVIDAIVDVLTTEKRND